MNYGFQLAGLQYRNECFCGQEMPHQSIKLSHSACNMRCPGSHAHNCGGYFAIDIYKTGLERKIEMKILHDNLSFQDLHV